jgi:hypothetical protein
MNQQEFDLTIESKRDVQEKRGDVLTALVFGILIYLGGLFVVSGPRNPDIPYSWWEMVVLFLFVLGSVFLWMFIKFSEPGATRVRVDREGITLWYPRRRSPRVLRWDSPTFAFAMRKLGLGKVPLACYEYTLYKYWQNFRYPASGLNTTVWSAILDSAKQAGMNVNERIGRNESTVRIGPRPVENVRA